MSSRNVSPPKGFQLATAAAALTTFRHEAGPRRFLVADEVGLGKTVVARTIIQEMMRGKRTPLVVFYVASNLNIAHQNRAKFLELLPTKKEQDEAKAEADRLAIAANVDRRASHPRLQLYTLTPDTSVPSYRRKGGAGRMEERALIYRLLVGRFRSLHSRTLYRLFKGKQAGLKGWKEAVRSFNTITDVRELQDEFFKALGEDKALNLAEVDADSLLAQFDLHRTRPTRLLGSMRTALALAAMRALRPDLIIYDEFQKFRDLLISPKDTVPDQLVRALRGEGGRDGPALLLLSATPYRPYSTRVEETDGFSHHEQFFELVRFLFGDDRTTPKEIESALLEFGALLQSRGEKPDLAKLESLRDMIQDRLRPVLSRTERPDSFATTGDSKAVHPESKILSEDLRVFRHWAERLQAGAKRHKGATDLRAFAVPFWLSVPLPIQMLGRGYLAWKHADRKKRRRNEPVLRLQQRNRLAAPKVWPHPQLRELTKIVSEDRLSLPWVAPSLRWWPLKGAWSTSDANRGKLLIFSRFKAVPPALASILSFGLEAYFSRKLGHNYQRSGEAQPLHFSGTRPTLPALFFPSPTLIAFTDPRRDMPSTLEEVKNSMRRQVGDLLRRALGVQVKNRGRNRPLWKLLAALELKREEGLPDTKLPTWWEQQRAWKQVDTGEGDIMRRAMDQWNDAAREGLETITKRELSLLAEFALSGPGVALGRALYRFRPECVSETEFPELLDASWNGLRPYLNRSVFQAALTRGSQAYTKAIPQAVVAGNLESVLDEHLWITSRLDADAVVRFARDFKKVLGLREGRHLVHEPGSKPDHFVLRCHAAMPFADAKVADPKTKGDDRLRTDELRRSFNSPFWPHVLATTSMGQEGLDFHVWCKQLLHWDLCQSPLDLEQREGRIQRFGGLSVRLALAEDLKEATLVETPAGGSPWATLAASAERKYAGDKSGLTPWWSCPGEKIDRLFIVLPQSRETLRYDHLSQQRWLYRLALGQPHQQDFIENVAQLPADGREQYVLQLSAWRNEPI